MKTWWLLLLALALVLVLVSTRERFSPNDVIKAPPYDQAETNRIWEMLGSTLQDEIVDEVVKMRNAHNTPTDGTKVEVRQEIAEYNKGMIPSRLIASFYDEKFVPGTTPITEAEINDWTASKSPNGNVITASVDAKILKKYFLDQVGAAAAYQTANTSGGTPDMPTGRDVEQEARDDLARGTAGEHVFTGGANPPGSSSGSSSSGSSSSGSSSNGSGSTPPIGSTNTMTNDMPRPSASNQQFRITLASYMGIPTNMDADITKYANFVVKFYDEEYLPAKRVPTPEQINGWVDTQMDVPMEKKPGLKSVIDYWFTNGVPEPSSNGGNQSGSSGAVGSESTPESGSGSGTGTGGNTAKQSIWGPKWTSLGESTGGGNGNSTTTTKYPELMGGIDAMGRSQTKPKNELPSDWSLGITGGARFLPFSRQPGDMDMVPDPYRVAKTYSPSSYSSKTDPVPFLNDFSAFFK